MTVWITSGSWDLGEPEKHRLESAMNQVRGERILDIGCRDGTFALSLASKEPTMHVHAVDTDASSLAWAEKKAIELKLENVTFWNLDITTLKSTDGGFHGLSLGEHTFDTVCLMETLEHVPPDLVDRAYDNACKFVRPGGRLIVTVPANSHISDPDHRTTFYREFIHDPGNPKKTWIKECPHLWIAYILEFPA